MTIVIPKEFAYVALAAASTIFVYVGLGFSVGIARKKYKVQYPDMGSGIYAQKLSEKDWIAFNNVMRSHLNLSEQIPAYLVLLLLSGIFYPTVAASIGFLYTGGRVVYAKGYQSKGPQGRFIGAGISALSMISLLTLTVVGSVKTITG
ncbi:hypothetical protein BDF19DRAFT_449496 [Syncephalis fuscata]|nr:hypothetical protein BDF19DRAFT_449496 [Syncephalis fuscata]